MYAAWNDITVTLGEFRLELNLSINKGELVTLLGPSGCGKTTALRIAAGFIKPDNGNFSLNDKNLNGVSVSKRNIGLVFQNYALFPHLNVEENLAYGLKAKKTDKSIVVDEVNFILESLHLKGYNKRKIDSLSGGERQRVALGRSLAVKPDLLLLDEPLSALDADLKKRLRLEIKNIQREFNITTLYVTHDQDEALAISDRVALLNRGKLIQYSTPEELYNYPTSEFAGKFIGESNIFNIDQKRFFFRPESVKKGYNKDGYNFSGEIIESEFSGLYSRGKLKCSDGQIIKLISFDHHYDENYHILRKDMIAI